MAEQTVGVTAYSSLDSLPDHVSAFIAAASERDFFRSLAWLRIALRTAGPVADTPLVYSAEQGGRVVAVLILRERQGTGWLKTHLAVSPSRGMDAAIFGPLLDAELGMAGLREIVAAMARAAPKLDVFRFECLEPDAPECVALVATLRRQHMLVQPFIDPYSSYWEDVEGLNFAQFLERRSPEMRHFIDLQVGALAQSGRGRFAVIAGGRDLKAALVDYALVDLQSFKDQEIFPDCVAALLDHAAGAGMLRLGLLYVDDEPAAAQIWIVSAGRATIWRVRYARKFAILSVGAVLTFEMIRHVLQAEALREIEFGPSDDDGRHDWFGQHRERIGLVVFNPLTAKGWLAAARHFAGFALPLARRAVRAARRLLARRR